MVINKSVKLEEKKMSCLTLWQNKQSHFYKALLLEMDTENKKGLIHHLQVTLMV